VRRFQGAANLRDDPHRFRRWKSSFFTQHGAKIAASTNSMVMNLNPLVFPRSKMRNYVPVSNFASQDEFLFEPEEDFWIAGEVSADQLRATMRPSSVSRAL